MPKASAKAQPQLRAVHMGLFPTLGSLQEVIDLGESKLPITDKNELIALMMTYHNTLLSQAAPTFSQHD